MPFLNSNCVSSCHLTNERQSAAIRLGSAGPDNITAESRSGLLFTTLVMLCKSYSVVLKFSSSY